MDEQVGLKLIMMMTLTNMTRMSGQPKTAKQRRIQIAHVTDM
jgi:hypothetical protein